MYPRLTPPTQWPYCGSYCWDLWPLQCLVLQLLRTASSILRPWQIPGSLPKRRAHSPHPCLYVLCLHRSSASTALGTFVAATAAEVVLLAGIPVCFSTCSKLSLLYFLIREYTICQKLFIGPSQQTQRVSRIVWLESWEPDVAWLWKTNEGLCLHQSQHSLSQTL